MAMYVRSSNDKMIRYSLIFSSLVCLLFVYFVLLPSGDVTYLGGSSHDLSSWEKPRLEEVWKWLDNLPKSSESFTDGMGECHLLDDELCVHKESTEVVEAIKEGISHVHNFDPFLAMKAFRRGLRMGGECCSLYWGMIESFKYNKGFSRASKELEQQAREKFCAPQYASKMNQAFLEAITSSNFTYSREKFLEISRINKDDVESKLFLAMDINRNSAVSMQNPDAGLRVQGVRILERIIDSHPNNPAANHYWIHAWEDTLYPETAITSANILPVYAFNSPHMTHMSGHIYHRMGQYSKSADLFYNSYEVNKRYLKTQKITGLYDWEYTHNLAYLADMQSCSGRMRAAILSAEAASDLDNLRVINEDDYFPLNYDPNQSSSVAHYFYQGARTVAFIHIRHGQWDIASKKLLDIIAKISNHPDANSMRTGIEYLSILEAICQNRYELSQSCSYEYSFETIQSRIKQLEQSSDNFYLDVNIEALKIMNLENQGITIASCEGNVDLALHFFETAIDAERNLPFAEPPIYPYPSLLTKGEFLEFYLHEYEEAINCYKQILQNEPNYPFALFRLAKIYKLMDQFDLAEYYVNQFLIVWKDADEELEQLKEAKNLLRNVQ